MRARMGFGSRVQREWEEGYWDLWSEVAIQAGSMYPKEPPEKTQALGLGNEKKRKEICASKS